MASTAASERHSAAAARAPAPAATRARGEEAAEAEAAAAAARRDVFLLAGIRKLIRSFRSLSQIFEMYKDGDGDGEEDGGGGGMDDIEIGFPTDVQHVAHIGLDGTASGMPSLRAQLEGARELVSLSTNLSLEQFELAMASLAAHDDDAAAAARVLPRA